MSLKQTLGNFFPLILMVGLMIYIVYSGQRKEKKKKEQLMGALAKDMKVRTIGGVLGKVDEVRQNDVVLVIDERSNARITFSKSAIASIETGD
ncbi:MAG: preprotein translocase subunit YajC [Planctomycetes bacterium]|nr:preprotein translocase subunit YajC [Planctomycetota bacterium]